MENKKIGTLGTKKSYISDPPEPTEAHDIRGESPELKPPPVKKRRESPSHESRRSSYRDSEPRRRNRGAGPPEKMDSDTKWDDSRVQISPYMCDLNLKISDTNRAENVNYEGLGYCFGGAKATHGVRGGKVISIQSSFEQCPGCQSLENS